MYLMIENPGVSPVECFTYLGVSMSRYEDNPDVIGQFGSGSKHGVNLLLRNDINVVIYCGHERLSFFVKPMKVGDREFGVVCYQYGAQPPKETSLTTEHGVEDWNDVAMACREFVANAIDGSIKDCGSHKKVRIDKVNSASGVSGKTRVFIEYHPQVEQFHNELSTRFLHFSKHGFAQPIIPKEGAGTCRVYKQGVFVRTLSASSVFDYNLPDTFKIDESRTADDYRVRSEIANVVFNSATTLQLAKILKQVFSSNGTERSLGYLMPNRKNERLVEAFHLAFGKNAVLCPSGAHIQGHVAAKGYTPVTMVNGWEDSLLHAGVPHATNILDKMQVEGHDTFPPMPEMVEVVMKAWRVFQEAGLLGTKAMPSVQGFAPIVNGGAQIWGQYDNGTVYLHRDLEGLQLYKVALEEVAHHLSGANDATRDFQDFLLLALAHITK